MMLCGLLVEPPLIQSTIRSVGITPLDVRHFEYFQGRECLSNAHWLGSWRQRFDDELRLRQNHWKILGKTIDNPFRLSIEKPRSRASVYSIL